MVTRSDTLAALRRHIAQVAPHRGGAERVTTGISTLDAHIGGWPCPGVAAIHGAVGTGRLGWVLPALRAHTHADRTVAIVDPMGWLYPPGLPDIDLRRMMLVRCGATQAGWTAIQLAACGAIPLVILLDPPPLRRDGLRLARATETGASTAIVLTERPDPDLVAPMRLAALGYGRARIERGGRAATIVGWMPNAANGDGLG